MSSNYTVWLLILVSFISANLPWISDRFLFFLKPASGEKKAWMRLLEWLILYFITGLFAAGLEKKSTGEIFLQDWEFFVVGFFLYMVFAFPGFIYRYEFKPDYDKWKNTHKS